MRSIANALRVHRVGVVMMVAATVTLPMACGDDDDKSSSVADSTEYCAILAELDAAGAEAFGGLGEDATEQEYDAKQAEFVNDNRERFDDLIEAAPDEIRDDVRTVVKGAVAGPDAPEDKEASDRVSAFDARECGNGESE